jgi:hypothetical protein
MFILELASVCFAVAEMSCVAPGVGMAALAYAVSLGSAPVSPLSYFALFDWYCITWPITLAVLLTAHNPAFLPLVFVALALVQRQLRLKIWRGAM